MLNHQGKRIIEGKLDLGRLLMDGQMRIGTRRSGGNLSLRPKISFVDDIGTGLVDILSLSVPHNATMTIERSSYLQLTQERGRLNIRESECSDNVSNFLDSKDICNHEWLLS
jgi:hypothetical protein